MVGNLQGASPYIAASAEIVKNNDSNKESKTTKTAASAVTLMDLKVLDKSAEKFNVSDSKNDKKNVIQENVVDYSQIAKKMETAIADKKFEIQYSVDKETKKLVFKLVNKKTKETVEQYPPEVALKISKMITDYLDRGNVTDSTI